ncbi:MAG TPA: hypothetical protein VFH00_05050 [Candidatus Nitrosotalea sp.]|nr:hypothetical protein [Candidatus Nitrosotalea sp.]
MTQFCDDIGATNCPPIAPVMSRHPPEMVQARDTERGALPALAVKLVTTNGAQGGPLVGGGAIATSVGVDAGVGDGIWSGEGLC